MPDDDPVAAEARLAREMVAFAEENVAQAREELARAYDRDDEERIARAREGIASAEELLDSARRRLHAAHRLASIDVETVLDLLRALEGVDLLATPGCVFVYYDPQRSIPHDRRQPFATIVTDDTAHGASDQASDLARRGLFRVNLGVERETYRALLGPEPAWGDPTKGGVIEGPDHERVDVWLPHPVYAPMSWLCIVAPSDASWPRLKELLSEAHAKAKRHA